MHVKNSRIVIGWVLFFALMIEGDRNSLPAFR